MSSFNYISYWLTSFGTLVMKVNSLFYSDLKVVLVVNAPVSLERFTFFLLGLSDLDDSAIFKFCFEYFEKLLVCLKMLFKKIKPFISFCFSKKIIKKLLKSIPQNFYLNSVLQQHSNLGIFDSRSKKFDKILMLDGCFPYNFGNSRDSHIQDSSQWKSLN